MDSYTGAGLRYAGFWLRLCAAVIDGAILLIIIWLLSLAFNVNIAAPSHTGADFVNFRLFELSAILAAWVYFSVMECSRPQASLGKILMSIYVTDLDGDRMTFGRASFRYWMKYLSILSLFIGFITSAFSKQKQALHDKLVRTLVLKR